MARRHAAKQKQPPVIFLQRSANLWGGMGNGQRFRINRGSKATTKRKDNLYENIP